MQRRGACSTWRISADQRGGVDWATIQHCLAAVGRRPSTNIPLFDADLIMLSNFDVQVFETVESHECPLVQLADLFAGIAVFSGASYYEYEDWLRRKVGQTDMFKSQISPKLSHRERARFQVLKRFDEQCKKDRLGVSLKTHRRLRTLDGKKPLNFWLYQPQHECDVAPTRISK